MKIVFGLVQKEAVLDIVERQAEVVFNLRTSTISNPLSGLAATDKSGRSFSTGPDGPLVDLLQVTDSYMIFSQCSVVNYFIQDLIEDTGGPAVLKKPYDLKNKCLET